MKNREYPEVLSPAGDVERLEAAVLFGADAVYLAGREFGMRSSQTHFDDETLRKAVSYCHSHQVKVYVTVNTVPHNDEIDRLPDYLRFLNTVKVDAVIASDLGVLSLLRKYAPELEVHISTQAGVVNYESARLFYELGAKRVVLARELSLSEIAGIREKIPEDMEIEAFVHGAMCMSFSGRCVISNYLTGRDANRGECAQPCRWNYHLVEEKRPGEYFPVVEDEKGSYILNAKDLCLIAEIDKLAKAGVSSFKIEGRAKSSYYVSVITNAYRIAVDLYRKDREHFTFPDWLLEEVCKVSHRRYSTGFLYGTPGQYLENGGYIREWDIVAVVEETRGNDLFLTQKNRFFPGDILEVLEPGKKPVILPVTNLRNEAGEEITAANHPTARVIIHTDQTFIKGSILRKQKAN